MKVTILGTGIYSLAIALKIKKDIEIVMWTEDKNKVTELETTKKIDSIIKNINISNNIRLTNDYKDALSNSEYIIIGTSNKFVNDVCNNALPYYKNDIPIIILTKGMNNKMFISEIVENVLKPKYLTVFSGPTFAIDLINNNPCVLTIASYNNEISENIKSIFNTNTLSFQNSTDIIGTLLCGTYKNIIAIASGMCDEQYNSPSTRAFLLNYAINELHTLLSKLNCNSTSLFNYAGFGDFILTCTSTNSRNYSYGKLLAQDRIKSQEYLKNNTVEGYESIKELSILLKEKDINCVLLNILEKIIFNNEKTTYLIESIQKANF